MSWSKIVSAINSTVGTANFKPLNEIVEEAFAKLNEKHVAASNLLTSTVTNLTSGSGNYTVKNSKYSEEAETAKTAKTAQLAETANFARNLILEDVEFEKSGTQYRILDFSRGVYFAIANYDERNYTATFFIDFDDGDLSVAYFILNAYGEDVSYRLYLANTTDTSGFIYAPSSVQITKITRLISS